MCLLAAMYSNQLHVSVVGQQATAARKPCTACCRSCGMVWASSTSRTWTSCRTMMLESGLLPSCCTSTVGPLTSEQLKQSGMQQWQGAAAGVDVVLFINTAAGKGDTPQRSCQAALLAGSLAAPPAPGACPCPCLRAESLHHLLHCRVT